MAEGGAMNRGGAMARCGMRAAAGRARAPGPAWIAIGCLAAWAIASAAPAQTGEAASAGAAPGASIVRAYQRPPARDPAAGLARRLGLDSGQRLQVRRLLLARQAQIRSVWSNPAIEGSDRIAAVKAIDEGTVTRIRALLNDEQKKHYMPPHAATDAGTDSRPSVEDWLDASRRHDSAAGASP